HSDMIRRIAFHPDGKRAFSAGRDGLVPLWEPQTPKGVRQFRSRGNWADCLGVSPDGKYVATGGTELLIYEVETGKLAAECAGHLYGLTSAGFSLDGEYSLAAQY